MKPHDSLFRKIAVDVQVQQDLIGIAMPDLAPLIRMDSLDAVPDSFTNGAQADLLLAATDTTGSPHLIYFLVEHKSYVDRNVAVQLWGYVAEIWKRWVEQEKGVDLLALPHKRSAPRVLPRIHPIVLYHGVDPLTIPTKLSDLHARKEGAESAELEYRLIDIPKMEPVRDRLHALTFAFFIVLKHTRQIMTKWLAQEVLTAIADERIGGPMQEILFKYIAQLTPAENKDILLETTKEMQYDIQGGRNAMTMAESLVEDGKRVGLKVGRAEGLKKGVQQGREESMRNVVRAMVQEGIDYELVQRVTGLTAEEITALLAEKNEQ